jgi:hypothetical protein
MAETTITEASIRAALVDRLKATHVEIQDMSGASDAPAAGSVLTSSAAGSRQRRR